MKRNSNIASNIDRAVPNAQPLPFGFVESAVTPLAPPKGMFTYDIDYSKFTGAKFAPVVEPPPPSQPPAFTSYPHSPTWTLEQNPEYLGGWCYTSSCSTSEASKLAEKSRMSTLATPPEITPVWDAQAGEYSYPNVPGMVQMKPGISYCVQLDGKPEESLFVAALQTRDSLLQYPDGPEAVQLLDRLSDRVWGNPEQGIPPLYAIPGLERNDRSTIPDMTSNARYTGSFSIGSTFEKGHGPGKFVPAHQSNLEPALDLINELMIDLNRYYRLVAKMCLPKREYDLLDFHGIDNNQFSLGGLSTSAISVQVNSSFLINLRNLIKHIGAIQGKWHVDGSDCLTVPTLFLLFLRLPKGLEFNYIP